MENGENMKKIYDISILIHPEMVVYKGDPAVKIDVHNKIVDNKGANTSLIHFGSHTGTHIDAPNHFINDGKTTDIVDLSKFIGECKVFEIMNTDCIKKEHIIKLDIQKDDIILFKTDNKTIITKNDFYTDHVYINHDAAEYLVEIGVKTVGIDYLSVEQYQSTSKFSTHKLLLGNDICIIEGLNLSEIREGKYFISALPLKFLDGNGSPVRAVLMEL